MKTAIIIPARLESARFPGKVLQKIDGVTMLERVYNQACKVKNADMVYIVGPGNLVESLDISALNWVRSPSNKTYRNGTERVAEAARILSLQAKDIVINLQADLPTIDPSIIEQMVELLQQSNIILPGPLATAVARLAGPPDPDPNVVKVVLNSSGNAIYFSRAPISSSREYWYKHVGVYGCYNYALQLYDQMSVSDLELVEGLEQLRFLYFGFRPFNIVSTPEDQWSVNVPADLRIHWPQEQVRGHVV